MADLSKYSDEELKAMLASAKSPKAAAPIATESMTPAEAIAAKGINGLLMGAAPAVQGVGGAIGQAGYQLFQNERNQTLADKLKAAASAGKQGFFEERDAANKEQDLAGKMYPKTALASELAGSIATLPLIPVKGIAGAARLGAATGLAGAASKAETPAEAIEMTATGGLIGGAAGVAGKGLTAAANTKAGQAILSAPGKAFTKTANLLTGVPEKEIATYAKEADAVNKLIKESGGNITQPIDDFRNSVSKKIASKKAEWSQQIGKSLEGTSPEKSVDVHGVIESLEKAKKTINPLEKEAIGQIDDLVERVQELSPDGLASVQDLHFIKEFLQGRAKSSYQKGGQLFINSKESARAAKLAAREARIVFEKNAPAEVIQANRALSKLHAVDDRLNKNLLKEGASDSALMAVGSGVNPRNEKVLSTLGDLTDQNIVGGAEKLSAAQTFANPQWTPMDTTGKAAYRAGVGALAGFGLGGPVGAVIGAAFTSPKALKTAINTGKVSVDMIRALTGEKGPITDATINYAVKFAQTPLGQKQIEKNFNNLKEEVPTAIQRRISQ